MGLEGDKGHAAGVGEYIVLPAPFFLPTKVIYCGDNLAVQLYCVLKPTGSF